ncbi:hypothetical protein BDZ45DRAFT_671870 [Acephala macrosclerotiorum]|nr:hypothetical protein BDZ45DRAFT_671870 [Acephala macrosclerotiorum]
MEIINHLPVRLSDAGTLREEGGRLDLRTSSYSGALLCYNRTSHFPLFSLFFCANVFYSYQQNSVNGKSFTLRTRSLNGALYWLA